MKNYHSLDIKVPYVRDNFIKELREKENGIVNLISAKSSMDIVKCSIKEKDFKDNKKYFFRGEEIKKEEIEFKEYKISWCKK